MASTYLTRTTSSTDTGTKFTLSVWIKRSGLGLNAIYKASNDNNTNSFIDIGLGSDKFDWQIKNGSGTTFIRRRTNRLLRDTSGWYHLVARYDSTLGTASDRLRLYINGVLETSIDQDGTPDIPVNYSSQLALSGVSQYIGRNINSASQFFNGSMSHFYMCVGYSYAPTEFGETDSTTGQWKIKTSTSVSYGNNGWLILKDDNTITDQSSGSNDWSLAGGTLTNTLDCPDNVFATLNSLDNYYAGGTFANGDNTVTTINTGYTYNTSTFGVATGKWYWECKWSAQPTGSSDQVQIGIAKRPAPSSTTWLGQQLYTYGYQGSSGHVQNNNVNASGSVATPYSVGDIISVAMDLDNNKIHFAKNGAWTNSSDPAANSGGVTITAPDSTPEDSGVYFAAFGDANNNLQETGQFNFGNGFFGTSAVADNSTATASTPGTFNYDVPTGYEPLTTKGLNA